MTEESEVFEKLLDELREVVKTLAVLLNSRKDGRSGYWTRVVKKINKVFFIFYVTAASLFLVCMFFNWSNAQE